MSQPHERFALQQLLDGISVAEVRECCVEAMRRAHRHSPDERRLNVHGDLGRQVVPILCERKGIDPSTLVGDLSEPFIDSTGEPGMSAVFEFLVWFERAGFGVPIRRGTQDVIQLQITDYGRRFLAGAPDHPLLPGFVERVRDRCPGLSDEVVALLADVHACLDHMLMRPAIALLGVAYEVVVEHIFDLLVARGVIVVPLNARTRAAARIVAVRDAVDAVLPNVTDQGRDHRFAARHACEYANALRRRRNDASHTAPTYGFDNSEEVEEWIVSAGRHLPNLWRLSM